MFLTVPVYVTPSSWSAPIHVNFENRSIAGLAGPAGPAGPPVGTLVSAVPSGPDRTGFEAGAAAPAGSDDDPVPPVGPDEGADEGAGPAGRAEGAQL